MKKNKLAFTFIEIIIAIAITSMILLSIVKIFLFSNLFEKKVDISRVMQENVKNFTEIIAEDIRKNKIKKEWTELYSSWLILTTQSWSEETQYYLTNSWDEVQTEDDLKKCKKVKNTCILVRKWSWDSEPLVNSWVSFEYLHFYVSTWTIDWQKWLAKVTMTFIMKPNIKKWLSSKQIEDSKIKYQTTFTQRLYKYK